MGWYDRNSAEPLIEGMKTAETIEHNNTMNKKEFKQSWMGKRRNYGKIKDCMDSLSENARNNRRKRNMELAEKS